MTPSRLIKPFPVVARARRRAYELDVCTGGSCMGKLDDNGEPQSAINFLKKADEEGLPNVRNFEDASQEVRQLIDPWYASAKL